MARFSKNVLQKLRQAGWRPNRRVNIDEILDVAYKAECYLTQEMIDFLYEFQGLKLRYEDCNELFDFEAYLDNLSKESCTMLNGLFGESVFKIGVMYNSNLLLVISETNKMYGLTDGEYDIFLIGDSFDEAIEFICLYGLSDKFDIFEKRRIK